MYEPIVADYVPDGDDWTVSVTGRGRTLTATAPGLIAARDNADQLAEKIAPGEEPRTVVHTLNGDAVEFTIAYMTARLAKSPDPSPEPPAGDPSPEDDETPAPANEADVPEPTG